MTISTVVKEEEDLDLLCNTLNAEAGRFIYSDEHLYKVLLRAQAAIEQLELKACQYKRLSGKSCFCKATGMNV